MKDNCLKIAFYGKGGIGKSTISANISASFAKKGYRVLHIGCDPKADSTRTLMQRKIPTVLQQLAFKKTVQVEDIIYEGQYGVQCIEAGGPQAGNGCAGLGITTMMEELERLKVFDEDWDVITYDVLGDVVCGGFSVPMRKHYVDKVYVVTSAEYMALYAANNILKGVRRYSTLGKNMLGGIIHNHCRGDLERETVAEFAKRVQAPIIGEIAESEEIRRWDFKSCICPEEILDVTYILYELENCQLEKNITTESLCKPLTDEEFEQFGQDRYPAYTDIEED